MAPAENLKKRKIAVLGSRSVGKSSLVIQFIDNQFVESYYPTIEATFAKSVKYKGAEYDCEVIDTAGQVRPSEEEQFVSVSLSCMLQDEFSILNSKHAIGIHGYVLVYSVTSKASFDMIQIVYDKIIGFCGVTDIPCVVVGSKVDLESRYACSCFFLVLAKLQSSRQVSSQEGEKLAREINAAWLETSAKTNLNVGKVFESCLAEIEKRAPHAGEPPQSSRGCVVM
ncbi:P-loop containing nucleoside triphosphate hydrolase protein [Rhodocollybia butyracea]|uniref:P-loop containing nucleoside triphosphate hydrolase protein n=1 Tax=Rhodocollybia butyracea TaxID=206335 RepID=A0A9P5Q5M5_9AGAR|nr:P-loop containing nucleoside triphosphate hydrolase protein [Rhodocollybia butyracea]